MATASASVRTVLDRLDHVQPHGDYWMARCPAHEDRVASLSISVGEAGRTILKCHAGCETAAIVRALGIAWSDLFPPARQNVLSLARW